MNVRRLLELMLRGLDQIALPALFLYLAATFFHLLFLGATAEAGETERAFVFLAFATTFVRVVRETAATLRDFPYRLDWADSQKRDRAATFPILTIGALSVLLANPDDGTRRSASAAFFALIVVDRIAARWSQNFGETVGRKIREFFESAAPLPSLDPSRAFDAAKTSTSEFLKSAQTLESAENWSEDDGVFISSQRRTRRRDGSEQVVGEAEIEFESGAEIAILFLSFCPPFDGVPTFEFEQISDGDFELKTTSVQPFGVRLEARRRLNAASRSFDAANFSEKRADESRVRVEFFAALNADAEI